MYNGYLCPSIKNVLFCFLYNRPEKTVWQESKLLILAFFRSDVQFSM